MGEPVEEYILKENLKENLEFLLKEFKNYFDKYNLKYSISFKLFQDLFDKSWKVLRIVIKLGDVQEYIIYYLFNVLREIAKNALDEDKRKKIIISLEKDGYV